MTGNEPDDRVINFLRDFHEVAQLAGRFTGVNEGESLDHVLEQFLGRPVADLPVITERVPEHRFVDWDIATDMLAGSDPDHREVGIRIPMHYSGGLRELVSTPFGRVAVGQVDFVRVATGVDSHRSAIACGLRLFHQDGIPVAVFQRQADRRHGTEDNTIEVVSPEPDLADRVLGELRELATRHSVLRGQVISMQTTGYGAEGHQVTFLPRPKVSAEEVILPADTLDRISAHVIGIAEAAETLRANHQHLKRGLLLYGPPGTGKTHTVRHLLGRATSHTVVLLSGKTLQYVGVATQMARVMQPAIVVLEDCDLVAEDRGFHGGPQPLLFEVLDAMDGLDGDADVTFLLTTNRVADLERALAQRPGRVDLAVEVPLPDLAGRRQLLELYGRDLELGEAVVAETAEATEGMTASFFKELARRAVLQSALAGERPGEDHLRTARDGLLADGAELTRALLSGPSTGPATSG